MKKSIVLFLICFMPLIMFSQTKTVRGKVIDSGGAEMPGVNVVIKGTTTGTFTDSGGSYSILSTRSSDTLVFSFIGMSTKEILVGNQQVINTELQAESKLLEEIVVIGYGTVKKSDMTGSISSLKGEKLQSGVQGGGVSIRIRGTN